MRRSSKMNTLERANLIAELEASVKGGVAETLENLIESFGYNMEKLDRHTLAAIDERFFTCDVCNFSMPVDELSETEAGDGFLCNDCAIE
jgi:hypothetical protein